MSMEELLERSDLSEMQREQERERRRLRDRQRRQSMTLEQRENHLARRRRNYQLRRQRVANAKLDSQYEQTSIANGETITNHEHLTIVPVPEQSGYCNGVAHVGFDQGRGNLNAEHTKSEGFEVLDYSSAKFQGRLRLNHIRHLARSLNHPLGQLTSDNHQIVAVADVMTEGNAAINCRSPNGLRFNRVKCLARSTSTAMKESSGQNPQIETEGQRSTIGC